MPRIPDGFLDKAVFLYPTADAANRGESVGGSGFLTGFYTSGGTLFHLYAVTCAHVIADGSPVIRLNRRDGRFDVVPLDQASGGRVVLRGRHRQRTPVSKRDDPLDQTLPSTTILETTN